jgi:hypothetical protein
MKDNTNLSPHQRSLDPTWMSKTGGFARDMTLRDEFAARAVQGLLTHENCQGATWDEIPKYAYEMADAMLRAREQ